MAAKMAPRARRRATAGTRAGQGGLVRAARPARPTRRLLLASVAQRAGPNPLVFCLAARAGGRPGLDRGRGAGELAGVQREAARTPRLFLIRTRGAKRTTRTSRSRRRAVRPGGAGARGGGRRTPRGGSAEDAGARRSFHAGSREGARLPAVTQRGMASVEPRVIQAQAAPGESSSRGCPRPELRVFGQSVFDQSVFDRRAMAQTGSGTEKRTRGAPRSSAVRRPRAGAPLARWACWRGTSRCSGLSAPASPQTDPPSRSWRSAPPPPLVLSGHAASLTPY